MSYFGGVHYSEVGYASNPIQPDDKWDIYYDKFEMWLDREYDDKTNSVRGWNMTWEEACESEFLLDAFIEEYTDRSP